MVVDEQVCSLHISMQNLALVQVGTSLQHLLHVAFYLRFRKHHSRILQQPRQIVIHVWRDHEHAWLLLCALRSLHGHLFQLEDVGVIELLEQLDFTECRNRETILLIVHQDLLQCHHLACFLRSRLRYLPKCAFS
jgi:hypothetical protein